MHFLSMSEYNVHIWFMMNNMYIYVNCKLINIVIYIIDFFFISYEMCWLTEYPVGDVSFLLFEYNTHFFATLPPLLRGGAKFLYPILLPSIKCLVAPVSNNLVNLSLNERINYWSFYFYLEFWIFSLQWFCNLAFLFFLFL